MAESLSFDTTFLIDFQRERRQGIEGKAHDLAKAHAETEYLLSAVALGEFAAGFTKEDEAVLVEVRRRFRIVPIDEAVAMVYRGLFRDLKEAGGLIGVNDLWIAATAIHSGSPLATRNTGEFARVPGLRIVHYNS
jgi:tRNA(fMet)-specific endonuclease VapC